MALGRIAFDAILRTIAHRPRIEVFAHGAAFRLETEQWLLASYHPSRQNTQTGRLTVEMFDQIWERVEGLLPLIP